MGWTALLLCLVKTDKAALVHRADRWMRVAFPVAFLAMLLLALR